jgi:sugar lactone lactonase YvrE
MNSNRETHRKGGTVRLRRLLTGIGAALALTLALAASASARTVYDYVYSGDYIDGTAVSKPFDGGLADIAYDSNSNRLIIVDGGNPGRILRYNAAGAPLAFSKLGTNWFEVEPSIDASAEVAVDQSGTPATDGNFYTRTGSTAGVLLTKPDGASSEFEVEETFFGVDCGLTVSPDGTEILTTSGSSIYHYELDGSLIQGNFIGPEGFESGVKVRGGENIKACDMAFDNTGNLVAIASGEGGAFSGGRGAAYKVAPDGDFLYMLNHNNNGTGVAVDHATGDAFVLNSPNFGEEPTFEQFDEDGRLLGGGWGNAEGEYPGILGGSVGITVDPDTGDVWVSNKRLYEGVARVEKFERTNPHVIPDVTASAPGYTDPVGDSMTLRGVINADGVKTVDCHFEYGVEPSGIEESVRINHEYEVMTQQVPCEQGNEFTGTGDQLVTAEINTTKGMRYFYKLAAKNEENEQVTTSNVVDFLPQGEPKLTGFLAVDRVNTDGVRFQTEVDPNGGNVSVHFEYGAKGQGLTESTKESQTFGFDSRLGTFRGENAYVPGIYPVNIEVKGLIPGETYEYRAVATNEAGSVETQIQEFTTYLPDPGSDPCDNSEVRRQQNGSLLPDCRAYELVSAADQGGYDVISELVPGQDPLDAYPLAQDRVLYSMHFGVIPGVAGSPTNFGRDPYVAVRGANGWTTKYVGLPADGMEDKGSFGSPLLGADGSLENFAFGGPDICDPCFEDGTTNVPLRRQDGTLEKGMAGSQNPAADPVGEVRRPFSEDGTHFIFGADEKFEDAGNEGSVSIYDRNLQTGATQVVSTDDEGDTMSGDVAQLDVSSDGSHILIGRVEDEVGGNRLYDLYMHVGNDPESQLVVDTPGGVIYNGMTDDGSQVFFTSTEELADDGDTSADLFKADLGGGTAAISRLSTGSGGTGNTSACEPVGDWNVSSGAGDCSVVVPPAGAAVARDDGTVYFISPEQLDGASNGTAGEPNLYVVEPGASTDYVGEIDSSAVKPPAAPPARPVLAANFITSLSNPEGMEVDQDTGHIYVAERGAGGRIARYASTGAPANFAEGPGAGTNRIANSGIGGANESSIAVDSSGGPLDGAIYVRNFGTVVAIWHRSGVKLGELTGFGEVCGVAVDQDTGELFVGDYFGRIRRFVPNAKSTPVTKADYTETTIQTSGQNPCHVAADSAGHVFAASYSGGEVKRYNVSDFGADPVIVGTQVTPSSFHLSADQASGDLYVSFGNRIAVFDSSGNELQEFGSSESLGSSSDGLAVFSSTKETVALNGTAVVKFGYEEIPYEPIDHPAILHGLEQPDVHSFEDFQVTPDGRFALFASPVSLTGYQNDKHYELFRYDTSNGELKCTSCAPTNAVGKSDIKLSANGLNLTNDGRVFFTTLESLTLRDTNEKKDAYEWIAPSEPGELPTVGLISNGIGQDDSALLSVSADGKDAFFFTRDVLTPFDKNGNVVKVYTARVNGGVLFDPPRGLCKASDECHGPGTQQPPPPNINTGYGPDQARPPVTQRRPKKCRKGKVRRRGRCVTRKRSKRSKKHQRKRKGDSNRGRRG